MGSGGRRNDGCFRSPDVTVIADARRASDPESILTLNRCIG
jgi:hypothetical protein